MVDNGQAVAGPIRVSAGIVSFLATSLPVGVHVMTAQYSGDSNALGSTSAPLTQAITGQVIIEISGSSNGIMQTADFAAAVN